MWNRAQKKYEEARTSRKEAIIREVAGDGIAKVKDNILALRTKVQAAEDELRQLGFVLDDEGVLDLIASSSRLERTIESRLNVEVGTKDQVHAVGFAPAGVHVTSSNSGRATLTVEFAGAAPGLVSRVTQININTWTLDFRSPLDTLRLPRVI